MKCKFLKRFAAAVTLSVAALSLAGCGTRALPGTYDLKALSLSELTEGDSLYAEGFASDLCVPGNYETLNADGVEAEAFALFSVDDREVLAQKNIFRKVYPASTTKILTCLIALEQMDLGDTVTVPESAAITVSGSSMANLKPGDKLSALDLLYALMIPSGNDAAETIAYTVAGSDEAFAELMNQKALSLGATQTHFTNPHGLPDENHYTTPYDMYLIFRAAMQNETFRKIASQKYYEASVTGADGKTRSVRWDSSNLYLRGEYALPAGISYSGGKTGHTADAGYCLVMGETADSGKNYISVIYQAGSYAKLYNGMTALLEKSRG